MNVSINITGKACMLKKGWLETDNEKKPAASFVGQPGCHSSSKHLKLPHSIKYAILSPHLELYPSKMDEMYLREMYLNSPQPTCC
jgi:hypothetical protein